MSTNKLIVPGFGTGAAFGTPTTIALAETSTVSLTSALVGSLYLHGLATGVHLRLAQTTGGFTTSVTVLQGAPGLIWHDGVSAFLVNTTTSVTIEAISF